MGLKDLLKGAQMRVAEKKGGSDEPTLPRVAAAVDRLLLHRESLPSHRRGDVWHPSEMYEMCSRMFVLARRFPEDVVQGEPFETGLLRIFDVGHALHAWWQEEYLGPAGLLWGKWRCTRCHHTVKGHMPRTSCPECQWKPVVIGGRHTTLTPAGCRARCSLPADAELAAFTTPSPDPEKQEKLGGCVHCGIWGRWKYLEPRVDIDELNVHGKCDGLLTAEPWVGKPVAVLELKTANNWSYKSVARPTSRHTKQVSIYMCGQELKWSIVVYIDKNASGIKEFPLALDMEVIQSELDAVKEVNEYMSDSDLAEDLPDRHTDCPSRHSKKAKDCPVSHLCFGVE